MHTALGVCWKRSWVSKFKMYRSIQSGCSIAGQGRALLIVRGADCKECYNCVFDVTAAKLRTRQPRTYSALHTNYVTRTTCSKLKKAAGRLCSLLASLA